MSEQKPSTRDAQEEVSSENAEAAKPAELKFCKLVVKLDDKGQAEVVDTEGPCKSALEKSPPIRQAFWIRRLSKDVKKKLNLTDEKEFQ